jgi:hypothetical protein
MKSKVCLLILLLTPLAHASQPCVQPDLHIAAQQAKAIQTQLLAFKLQREMDESVPAPLQVQIRAFKDSLSLLADATLQCAPVTADPKAIQSRLVKLLDANKPVKDEIYDPDKPPQLDRIYGDGITVKVTAPANVPHMFLVEFSFDIACGSDSLLLAYEWGNGRWRRTIRWQSTDYDDVSGAFGDFFQYHVLPQTEAAGWLLVVGHGHPWCASNMSSYHFDVLRPIQSAGDPQVLFRKDIL